MQLFRWRQSRSFPNGFFPLVAVLSITLALCSFRQVKCWTWHTHTTTRKYMLPIKLAVMSDIFCGEYLWHMYHSDMCNQSTEKDIECRKHVVPTIKMYMMKLAQWLLLWFETFSKGKWRMVNGSGSVCCRTYAIFEHKTRMDRSTLG